MDVLFHPIVTSKLMMPGNIGTLRMLAKRDPAATFAIPGMVDALVERFENDSMGTFAAYDVVDALCAGPAANCTVLAQRFGPYTIAAIEKMGKGHYSSPFSTLRILVPFMDHTMLDHAARAILDHIKRIDMAHPLAGTILGEMATLPNVQCTPTMIEAALRTNCLAALSVFAEQDPRAMREGTNVIEVLARQALSGIVSAREILEKLVV